MSGKENIIIVKSDPSFEWERKAPKKKKPIVGKIILKLVTFALVACISFGGAMGGMAVYSLLFGGEKGITPGEDHRNVVIQQYTPQTQQTNKPAADGSSLTVPQIYDKVSQSTVLFTCESTAATGSGGFDFGFDFSNPFGDSQGSVGISYGSGIIMSQDGYIMTNAHVVDGTSKINVTLFDGTQYEAKLIGSDKNTDIAVVKIDANNLPAATFSDSDKVSIGDDVYVVGNPLGVELSFSMTCGYVSSLNRQIDIEDTLMSLIQVDAAVNPGNSGGPAADLRGNIIGVVNAKIVDDDVEGVGFAIPANTALKIAGELINHGKIVSRPTLGITVESISFSASRVYPERAGVTVSEVTRGSCADKGGLQVGDKITHFNGVKIYCNAELNFQKERYSVGDTVTMTVVRNGKTLELTINLTN